jgi:uncharacterized protein with von Willebrand factor type A (vWA) domain
MPGLVYNATDWQRFLWDDHKRCEPTARQAEAEGRERYSAFGEFASEAFHRLYAETPEKLETPADGAEWAERLHDAVEQVPEYRLLQDRTRGNEWWSGIATESMLHSVLKNVSPPREHVDDPRQDAEVADYLRRLAEQTEVEDDREDLNLEAQHREESASIACETAADQADLMDQTQMRNAVRDAVTQANKDITDAEHAMDAFGLFAGTGAHSRKQAHSGPGRKLAAAIRDNQRFKSIVDMAGRLRRVAVEKQRSKTKHGTSERDGIKNGRDIPMVLPSEFLALATPEMRALFAIKYSQRSLMQHELKPKPKKQQGPIVMLIDSSASMGFGDGDATAWAAAVSLAYLEIAQRQGRAFAMLHFGTATLKKCFFPARKPADPEAMLDAVTFFAATGGTEFMLTLDDAAKVIRQEVDFSEADVVMVTDGGAGVNSAWLQRWQGYKSDLGFSCYSILVGNHTYKDTCDQVSDECVFLSDAVADEAGMYHLFGQV